MDFTATFVKSHCINSNELNVETYKSVMIETISFHFVDFLNCYFTDDSCKINVLNHF